MDRYTFSLGGVLVWFLNRIRRLMFKTATIWSRLSVQPRSTLRRRKGKQQWPTQVLNRATHTQHERCACSYVLQLTIVLFSLRQWWQWRHWAFRFIRELQQPLHVDAAVYAVVVSSVPLGYLWRHRDFRFIILEARVRTRSNTQSVQREYLNVTLNQTKLIMVFPQMLFLLHKFAPDLQVVNVKSH